MRWKRAAIVAALLGCALPMTAGAVCRVVEPSADSGGQGVLFDPETTVLVVKSPDQIVDYECPEEALLGMEDRPWEREDPSVCPDGVTMATPIRDHLVHVAVQPSLYAMGGNAGLIMPLPRRSDVNAGPVEMFEVLERMLRVRVRETLEFVEDGTLGYQCSDPHYSAVTPQDLGIAAAPLMVYGCGDSGDYYRPGLEGIDTSVVEYSEGDTVEYEMIPVSADYEAYVLNASSLAALSAWMDERGFEHDEVDDAAFARYIGEDRWFVAIDVHPPDLGGEQRALAPLVVTYRGTDFPITHELTFDPEGGIIETDLFVLSPMKAAISDGDAVTLYAHPFELDTVAYPEQEALRGFGLDSGYLTRLHMERRMSDALQLDTELVDSDDVLVVLPPPIERTTRVRIAQACCGGGDGNTIPSGGGRTFTEVREYDLNDAPSDETLFYRAPAADRAYCPGGSMHTSSSYDDDYDYGCTVAGAAASWSPLLLVVAMIRRRRRT